MRISTSFGKRACKTLIDFGVGTAGTGDVLYHRRFAHDNDLTKTEIWSVAHDKKPVGVDRCKLDVRSPQGIKA
jgi:hypothetical protein